MQTRYLTPELRQWQTAHTGQLESRKPRSGTGTFSSYPTRSSFGPAAVSSVRRHVSWTGFRGQLGHINILELRDAMQQIKIVLVGLR